VPGDAVHEWPEVKKGEATFAILTDEPNELVASIHDRMTTFIEPRDYDEYLAPSERPPMHLLPILPFRRDEGHDHQSPGKSLR
jgi:putative SOS response-associated peptidase YedK